VLVGLFFLRFYHVLLGLWGKWREPSWSHGYLIPLFSLWFLYVRRHKLKDLAARRATQSAALRVVQWTGLLFVAGGMALDFVCSYYLQTTYGRYLGMLVAVFGLVLFLGGWQLMRQAWVSVVFLVFMLPVPYQYYERVAAPLQELAARTSVTTLNVAQVGARREGTVIKIPMPQSDTHGKPILDAAGERVIRDEPLNVAEACAGLRLLTAFIALGVAFAYISEKPMWQRLTLILSTVPIAVFCNVVRVVGTGFLYRFVHRDTAKGFLHDFAGIVMLLVAMVMLMAVSAVLGRLSGGRKEAPADEAVLSNELLRRLSRLPAMAGGIALVVAAALLAGVLRARLAGWPVVTALVAATAVGVCAVGLYERSRRIGGRARPLLYAGFGMGVAAVLAAVAGLTVLLVRSGNVA
jgi:exosortase/archaeosortase family protein